MVEQLLSAFGDKMIINPYRYAGGPTTLISTTFPGTNGSQLTDSTPEIDVVGGGWVYRSSTDNGTIQLGRAQNSTGGATTNVYTMDSGQTDVDVTCTMQLGPSDNNGIIVRAASATQYWAAIIQLDNTFIIFEFPSLTVRANTSVTISESTDYTVRMFTSGNDISATLDGANLITYNSATYNTATDVGIRGLGQAQTDDFVVLQN